MHQTQKIITDALGFTLKVEVAVGDFETLGKHHTYVNEYGAVEKDIPHTIQLKMGMTGNILIGVAAHEAYHLFYSIRHLITCNEEVEAEVFGELVVRILKIYSGQVD